MSWGRSCLVGVRPGPRDGLYGLEDGLEDIGRIVGHLLLQHGCEALKAKAGVDMPGRQWLQVACGLSVVLHSSKMMFQYVMRGQAAPQGTREVCASCHSLLSEQVLP